MEAKRQLDVLDRRLADSRFVGGDEYSIADVAIWPWYGQVALGQAYDAAEFLSVGDYRHLMRWAEAIADRPAVKRGRIVNRTSGEVFLRERHEAADIDAALAGG
jgi:GST-like protein